MNGGQFGLRLIVVVFHALNATQHFGKIECLDGDTLRFENLFAIANGVERGRSRADGAYAQVAEALHHPAHSGEPFEIFGKLWRAGTFRVQCSDGIGNAVLSKIIASRHLAAEAVTARSDGHLLRIIRRGLNQYRHTKIGQPQGIGNGPFFAEVGQRNNDAVDPLSIALEQLGTAPRVFPRLYRSVLALFRRCLLYTSGSPAANSNAAIDAACPTHSVMTSFFTYCMVS